MSENIDKSLDVIIGERKSNRKHLANRRNRKAAKSGNAVVTAPVGGVKKHTKPAKPVTKGVPLGPSTVSRSSKIVVSGLVRRRLLPHSCTAD